MNVPPVTTDNVTFGYKSILKTEYRKGKIPLKKDITGHKLIKGRETVDHTIPKSKGGKSSLFNYSIMDQEANNLRGNKPLKEHINLESFVDYIVVMMDVKTKDLDGIKYLKGWLKNVQKALKEGK